MTELYTNKLSTFNNLSPIVEKYRKAENEVHPLFLNRWSPRSYSEQEVNDIELYTILEAAAWAPSASNEQPWRFFIARTAEEHALFNQFINSRNQLWSQKAPVLILLASEKIKSNNDPNHFHAFDTGAAWANLALQASILGLSTRAIGGFDKEKAKEVLEIPDHIELHIVIALGYQGEKESLHEDFRPLEIPNSRRSLKESILSIKKG